MTDDLFDEYHFVYGRELRNRFTSGELPRLWKKRYPQLFTQQDLNLTERGSSYHFFEWLGAVLLYEATGYVSYYKWDCKVHRTKHALLRRLAGGSFVEMIEELSGCPDLMAVAPDSSDFFFCEVKGSKDKIRPNQKHVAREILAATGRKVALLYLWPID